MATTHVGPTPGPAPTPGLDLARGVEAGRPGQSRRRRLVRGRLPGARTWTGLFPLAGLAALAQLLAGWHLGWAAVVAAVVLTVRRGALGGTDALGRTVPVLWWLVAGAMLLGWVGPFWPALAQPWALVAVLAPLWLQAPRPGGRPRPAVAARAWAVAIVPTAVLGAPFLLRDLAGRISLLGFGWDNAYHVLMLQAVLRADGYPVIDPATADSVTLSLLSYPMGPHQMWAMLLRAAGIGADTPAATVDGYLAGGALSYLLLGLSLVWAYRRLTPVTRRSWWVDLAGLTVIAAALVVTPLPAMWRTGFFNYVVALAAAVTAVGLVAARQPCAPRSALAVASALSIVVGMSYPLLLPVVGVAWLVVAARVLRRLRGSSGVATVVLTGVLTALALFPAAVPYVVDPVISTEMVLFGGGLAQIPWWLAAVTVGAGAVRVLMGRRRPTGLAGAGITAMTAWVLFGVLAAWSMARQGFVSYYPDKVLVAALAVTVPFAGSAVALGADRLRATGPRRRLVVLGAAAGGLGLVLLAVAPLDSLLPRDPAGRVVAWPGPVMLQEMVPADAAYFVHGERLLEAAALRPPGDRSVVVLADWYLPPLAEPDQSWALEQRWSWVLAPTDVIAAQWLAATLEADRSEAALVTVVVRWARANPGLGVILVVGDSAIRGRIAEAIKRASDGGATDISVVVGSLPLPPTFEMQDRDAAGDGAAAT